MYNKNYTKQKKTKNKNITTTLLIGKILKVRANLTLFFEVTPELSHLSIWQKSDHVYLLCS